MALGYLGEIRIFAGNYAPEGWMTCDGSLISIAQYSALYALLGTTYGGDGTSTFGLPDLRGRVPIHQGQQTGVTPPRPNYPLGQSGGAEMAALSVNTLPSHTHAMSVSTSSAGAQNMPDNNFVLTSNANLVVYSKATTLVAPNTLNSDAMADSTGNGFAHNNMMPTMALRYIINVQSGEYPTSN